MAKSIFSVFNSLQAAIITVRQQARTRENLPDLMALTLFPRNNVNSTKLSEITEVDYRFVADRRPWDAKGRNIPLKAPDLKDVTIEPIEAFFRIDEREMNDLYNSLNANQQLIQDAIRSRIPQRTSTIVDAVYRRLEVDAYAAWANGEIVVMNPETGDSYTVSLQMDANRYVTPAAWTGGEAGNAYANFLEQCYEAQDAIGSVRGAVMRHTTALAIQQSAPKIGGNSVRMTRKEVADRISQELGVEFTIMVEERTQEVFDDGGTATTKTKLWPTGKIGFMPSTGVIGNTYAAPVYRAQDLAQIAGDKLDIRGVSVFFDEKNNGKSLVVEAQANWLPMPNEQNVYVVDAGI